MNWATFAQRVADWLDARHLLRPGAQWVVGASGGADSTVLLRTLVEIGRRRELGWRIHAAHLHHGLRGEAADADAAFVSRLAAQLDVPAHHERADIGELVRCAGGSTEEAARTRRYQFLERVALTTGSEFVAVAHHADDNAETVLHRICRGTGLRGLAGMHDVRPIRPGSLIRLVRPLLGQRREDIEAVCRSEGLEYRTDDSNYTEQFTRGRIRNRVLPLLRSAVNPNTSEALLRLAEQARWLGTYLEDAAARVFETMLVSEAPGEIVLNTRAFLHKQRIIQAEVVRRAVTLVTAGDQELGFSHVEAVLALLEDPTSGKELHLPGRVVVRKVYQRLVFQTLDPRDPPAATELRPVAVQCPGVTPLPELRAELLAEVREFNGGDIAALRSHPHPNEEWIDLDRVVGPLIVRGRRAGDRFRPLGAPGAKSLADFLSDEKIDPVLRAGIGVLCDQQGPLWVIPLRIDERVRLRDGTQRVLRLVYRSCHESAEHGG